MQEQANNLFTFMQESMNAGLVSMAILLTQIIKNQKWMRQRSFASVQLTETNDPLTMHTLEIIERVCQYSQNGLSQTLGRFLDKIGFFEHLAEALFQDAKQEDVDKQEAAAVAKAKGQSLM